ncbi:hypothetical protein HGH93_30080 [Chitinophaga polysaccharea]|uniref:hypothetical protein n=1 Tax=Chitinophaga TaxID=79328 RepID=UPI001455A06A|nr:MULTISPECIES: hypothetical protein [Chitinophaga]NLR62378.1 hypothetical protein [Chitinophaga polysaccharea]NLU92449.1 hypothetical protein [Chitinophaga sp. Ak27]
MMFSKVFPGTALLFLLLFSTQARAQSPKAAVTDITFDLVTWTRHLNNDIDKYFSREKAADLNQHLEDLKRELKIYMKLRKSLSDSLFRNNITPGKKDEAHLEALKSSMNLVMEQMRNVTDYVSDPLKIEGDKLNDQIYDILYGQQVRYLSNLDAFLAGNDISKRDLAIDGSACYGRLEESLNQIAVLQEKIARKR